ncbi:MULTISPECIES: CotS family spore coat protein [Clostridium]|uniref:Spore coat protein, CotS family n=1 Tax=Clostridium disporicum TaxID=84024 RepID=A0A174FTG9_9CLOT|nr:MULTISPECIES: CotS family spore coat protein [Clostridium]MCD2501466.1 CotS family spore coat protein [Clostridium sp. NSJ-145]CUO53493.1 spore coat protein%2C CotS family [Clostridium disporicum]
MVKTRYVDKNILCEYDFKEEFINLLGIKINDVIPLRKVFVLFTDKGKKVLKITDSTKDRIDFIDKVLKIIESEYPMVLKYTRNTNGDIITVWKGKKYVLLDMVEGREATFTNPIEVELCTKAIAKMHIASNNIFKNISEEEIKKNSGENLINKMEEEYYTLLQLEELVNKYRYKNEFDNLFLQNVDNAKKDLIKTIEELKNSRYESLINNKENRVLCHNDLAHHNFIIDGDKVNIIDFDYCSIDMRIVDIYGYAMKVIKNLAYNEEIIELIIKSYDEVNKLEKEEVEILRKLINYPKDFISIATDYYFKQKAWSEEVFLSRLKNKLEIDKFRIEFLNN